MLINKAYKFRAYPNNEQKELINKTLVFTKIRNFKELGIVRNVRTAVHQWI